MPLALRPGGFPLEPPSDLTDAARELFREIVKVCPPDHFQKADCPLLCVYCEAVIFTRTAGRKLPDDLSIFPAWEKAARLVAQLAGKLRLCPSARIDARAAARRLQGHPVGPAPWEE
jgi:hypothetical protein